MPDQDQRYHGHEVGEGEYVILDELNDKAWVQSDYTVPIGDG